MTRILGLTGGIASGKSTVAKLFKEHDAVVIDADKIAHQIMTPGQPGLQAIVATFGGEYLASDGTLDRRKLGQLVFSDQQALTTLNQLTHPLIRQEIIRLIKQAQEQQVALIVLDVPLLFETGYEQICDAVLVVDVAPEIQIQRVMQRDHLDEAGAKARIAAQMNHDERLRRADFVIDTSKTVEELPQTFEQLYQSADFQKFMIN